jgi:hypothetical protein
MITPSLKSQVSTRLSSYGVYEAIENVRRERERERECGVMNYDDGNLN